MKRRLIPMFLLLLLGITAPRALGESRFPPPDFDNPHPLPTVAQPPPASYVNDYVDVGVLLGTLALAAYLVHFRRSRLGISILCVFSVAYFGFYRKGCVCSIGSIQNVALAVFNHNYALPLMVAVFFLLPLAFAFFFGRVFCSAVCPMGAAQDLVHLKSLQLPRWLDHSLGLIPFVYLGLGVLFAATGTRFIICEWDPFVPLFRLTGSVTMLSVGAVFLLVGIVVGRPYCRFLCPYGALLSLASMVSQWRVSIFPDECVSCHLCQKSCPVNAIQPPAARPGGKDLRQGKRRLAAMLALAPVLAIAGACIGWRFGPVMARVNDDVQLASLVAKAKSAPKAAPIKLSELDAFRYDAFNKTGESPDKLYARADALCRQFALGGMALGAWVGLVVGAKLIGLARARARTDYETDRATCVACGRCFDYCPKEYERRGDTGLPPGTAIPGIGTPQLVPLTLQGQTATPRATTASIQGGRPQA